MKIRCYSDIHLDTHCADENPFVSLDSQGRPNFWYPPDMPDDKETTLILAGDVWIGTRWIEWCGFSWINYVASKFKEVIVVFGNHDLWPHSKLSIKNHKDKAGVLLQDLGIFNVHILDSSVLVRGDVLFVGNTLWSSMNKQDPLAMYRMPQYMNYDGKIAFDTGPNGAWTRFTSQLWVDLHHKQKEYIRLIADQNPTKKIVVVTHHVPILGTGEPQYINDPGNCYYESDLSDIILDNPHIKLWCCGHMHNHCNEIVGKTLIYRNPVGYSHEQKDQQGLIKHEVINV